VLVLTYMVRDVWIQIYVAMYVHKLWRSILSLLKAMVAMHCTRSIVRIVDQYGKELPMVITVYEHP